MSIDYVALGKRIKAARAKCGLTQEKLAERAHLTTSHISKIETADTKPSLSTVVDLANVMHTSVDALLADNVQYPTVYLQKDFEELLEDASREEMKIMIDTLRALKKSMRANLKKETE